MRACLAIKAQLGSLRSKTSGPRRLLVRQLVDADTYQRTGPALKGLEMKCDDKQQTRP